MTVPPSEDIATGTQPEIPKFAPSCIHTPDANWKTDDPLGRAPFELPVTGVFVFRDEKIVEWRDYFDTAQLAEGLGQSGAPPGA